jgi:hypothetical protein
MLFGNWWNRIQETEDRKSKAKSAFLRRKEVKNGLVRKVCSSLSLSALDGRVWIGSSVEMCFEVSGFDHHGWISVVAFERRSSLERIFYSGFRRSGLKSIVLPSSVVILGQSSFDACISLESVTFESGSRLERIEDAAFYESGLKSIVIPSSVVVLGQCSFHRCRSLESVRFESGSRLERIGECGFKCSGLNSIEIPSSVVALGKESFGGCKSLESVTFESGSRLERIEESAFQGIPIPFCSISDGFTWSKTIRRMARRNKM